jgi:hypothetical protein
LRPTSVADVVQRRFWGATNSGGSEALRELATYVLAREWYAIVSLDPV